jgi:ribosomal-protein-alanine N-acetyltransferase
MTPILETARLLLKPLELADAGQIQALFPHWEIVRFLTKVVPWPYPPDGALTFLREAALPAMEQGDAWHWTLRLREKPVQVVGSIGVMKGDINRGFWTALPWQERGLMTEASVAVTDYWFDTLGFPIMRIPKAIENIPSRRISERQGMRVIAVEEREYVSGTWPIEIWEITAEEWRIRRTENFSKTMSLAMTLPIHREERALDRRARHSRLETGMRLSKWLPEPPG